MSGADFSDILLREPCVTRSKLKHLKASGYNNSCRVLIVRKRSLDALALLGRPGRRIHRTMSLGGMRAHSPNSTLNQSTSDSVRGPSPDHSNDGMELISSPQRPTSDSVRGPSPDHSDDGVELSSSPQRSTSDSVRDPSPHRSENQIELSPSPNRSARGLTSNESRSPSFNARQNSPSTNDQPARVPLLDMVKIRAMLKIPIGMPRSITARRKSMPANQTNPIGHYPRIRPIPQLIPLQNSSSRIRPIPQLIQLQNRSSPFGNQQPGPSGQAPLQNVSSSPHHSSPGPSGLQSQAPSFAMHLQQCYNSDSDSD